MNLSNFITFSYLTFSVFIKFVFSSVSVSKLPALIFFFISLYVIGLLSFIFTMHCLPDGLSGCVSFHFHYLSHSSSSDLSHYAFLSRSLVLLNRYFSMTRRYLIAMLSEMKQSPKHSTIHDFLFSPPIFSYDFTKRTKKVQRYKPKIQLKLQGDLT